MAIVRYDNSGSLDLGFGDEGLLTVDFHAGFDSGLDVAIQPDGKIVAAGKTLNVTTIEQAVVRTLP